MTGGGALLPAVERCWRSGLDPHVDAYRAAREVDRDRVGIAVVVQELVAARAAGVLFTRHPLTGDRSLLVIESSFGLGEAVVGGEVTPDLIVVNKVTREIHERSLGSKPTEHRLSKDGSSVETREVTPDRRREWSIDHEEIQAVISLGLELEQKIGRGLDIEWAFGTTAGPAPASAASGGSRSTDTSPSPAASGSGDTLFALQVRPITTGPANAHPAIPASNPVERVLSRLVGGGAERGARPA